MALEASRLVHYSNVPSNMLKMVPVFDEEGMVL